MSLCVCVCLPLLIHTCAIMRVKAIVPYMIYARTPAPLHLCTPAFCFLPLSLCLLVKMLCVCVCVSVMCVCASSRAAVHSCCITLVVSQPPSPAAPWGPSLCKKDITAEQRQRDITAEQRQAALITLAAPATIQPASASIIHKQCAVKSCSTSVIRIRLRVPQLWASLRNNTGIINKSKL